ncbi:MAG: exodeoxyribonuclease V subunit gamma [Thalassolituus sp.]|uniref:exodeoxyribonuclease V subunit gamma n=1 Tax=Thalassolituus sp. TaxID=2030822 RepID=UPI003981D02F
MFRLYHSNDLDVLKGIMLVLMREQPLGPLAREAILVQSQGMAHWLKLQLADGLGIAAQVDFPLPSSYVWTVFNQLKPELPERSHFDKQAMAWKLMRLLPALVSDPEHGGLFAPVKHYLEHDEQGIKCYQLAHKIADVFDQYLVYRPDWLLAWERGDDKVDDTDVSSQPWQPHLWRALVADSKALGNSLDHRARLLEQLSDLVGQHPERLASMPKRLFVFGIAALPGSYWQVLNAISDHIDVHFFLLNPCRNFWGDIVDDRRQARILRQQPEAAEYLERGNPLLASWGRLGRDFLTLVHDGAEDGRVTDVEAWVDPATVESGLPMLKQIQADILELFDRQALAYGEEALTHSQFKQMVAANDTSVQFVAGHSALREVQRLHDQLLAWLSADATLHPRDIVVMVPDIDLYAPYIDAVFASAPEGQRIPWAIADQSMVSENPLLDSVISLMGLADSRLLLTDVQDWLDVAAIRRRFDIDESELDTLRDWFERAQIRWGLDGNHRQQLGLPNFEQNSWRKGLRQLLLGLMLPDINSTSGEATHWQGDWPVSAVEGNAAELLGKLLSFVDALENWQHFFSQSHNVDEWLSALPQLLNDLYLPDLDDTMTLQRVRDAIERWRQELADAAYDGDLPAAVIKTWFNEQLGQQGGWQRFLTGPVNFCTLMPMRSIPFKIVCMIGMNDQDYPRQVTPIGFDLMVSGKSRRGDRSRRDDDRYLFLEALCSAQEKLYISYRGRDSRENSELQPSVLVSELIDYICDGFCLADCTDLPARKSREQMHNWLIEELPLQPFSSAVYQPTHPRSVVSHHPLWAAVANVGAQAVDANRAAQAFLTAPLNIPADLDTRTVAWKDIKEALLKPSAFFLRRRLKADLNLYWQQHTNEEPFNLDGLERYKLRNQLVDQALAGHDANVFEFTQQQQALGHLPVNNIGQVHGEGLVEDVAELIEALQSHLAAPAESRSLSVECEALIPNVGLTTTTIEGELQQVFAGRLLHYRVGDIRGSHLLSLWLDLVFIVACDDGSDAGSKITGADIFGYNKKLLEQHLSAPSHAEAVAYVQQCLALYWQHWCEPSDQLPDILWTLLKNDEEKHDKIIVEQLNRDIGEFAQIESQRCLPDLPRQLLDDELRASWLDKWQWLMSPIQAHDTSADSDSGFDKNGGDL